MMKKIGMTHHSSRVLSSILSLCGAANVLIVSMWVSSGFPGFLPPLRNWQKLFIYKISFLLHFIQLVRKLKHTHTCAYAHTLYCGFILGNIEKTGKVWVSTDTEPTTQRSRTWKTFYSTNLQCAAFLFSFFSFQVSRFLLTSITFTSSCTETTI